MPRRAILLLPLLAAACAEPDASDGLLMSEAEARAALTATPFVCRQGQARWNSRFSPNGDYAYVYEGQLVEGAWTLSDGQTLCTRDAANPREQCYGMARRGSTVAFKREDGEVFQCRPIGA